MNKHTRLVVSVLFIVIIALAIAITRFYSGSEKITGSGSEHFTIERKLDIDGRGNRIFQDSSGLYGIIDVSERVIVSPEWQELRFAGEDRCIASKRIMNRNLFGCIDYEGNIIAPFVYSSVERIQSEGNTLYIGYSADGSGSVVYNDRFVSCLSRPWDSCTLDGSDLVLRSGSGSYTYSITDQGLIFKYATVGGLALNSEFDLEVTSRVLLSKLDPSMLEQMADTVGRYVEYAFTGNSELLADIKSDQSAVFLTIFPEDHSIILKRMSGISDIFVYSVRSDDKIPHYAVSVKVDTTVMYRSASGRIKKLNDEYKAVVEFTGSSASELNAVSGSFLSDTPDYPPEPEDENGNTGTHQ